jgi:hypothetical protein
METMLATLKYRNVCDRLPAVHLADNNAVITAVRNRVGSGGANFYESNMQALVYHWRKCIASGGDYVEG